MTKIIKLNEFEEVNENLTMGEVLFGKVLPFLGEGFIKTLKQKIAAILMEKIGILEDSKFSIIIQELVDAIPAKDLPGLMTGEKANAEYLAPKLAQACQEYIQRKGLDSLFEPFGIDPNGWLASTVREGIQSEIGQDKLEAFFVSALGGERLLTGALAKLDPEDKKAVDSALVQQAAKAYPTQVKNTAVQSKTGSGLGVMDTLSSIWSGLLSGSAK
jgi:hypothetical protein